MRILVAIAIAGASTAAVAGCGGSSDGELPVGGPLPECAQANVEGRAVERPPQLPADFPLPPGLVLTLATYEQPVRLVLNGFAPGDLGAVGRFFETELPRRGYRLGRGDQEEFEKEAPFTGRGFRGLWRIFGSPECPTAVRVLVILLRQQ